MMTGMAHQRVKELHCNASGRPMHLEQGAADEIWRACSVPNRSVDANADWAYEPTYPVVI